MFEGPQYVYRVKSVDKVVDGDTVDLTIDLGFGVFTQQRIRLAGIDTPELRGGTEFTKELAQEAKKRVEEFLSYGEIFVRTEKDRTGKYGRYLGHIIVVRQSGIDFNLNEILVEEGLAKRY